MEEAKKERTVDEIQHEYTQTCARAGHLQYQIASLESDLALVNLRLKELNIEAGTQAAKDAVAKAGETK